MNRISLSALLAVCGSFALTAPADADSPPWEQMRCEAVLPTVHLSGGQSYDVYVRSSYGLSSTTRYHLRVVDEAGQVVWSEESMSVDPPFVVSAELDESTLEVVEKATYREGYSGQSRVLRWNVADRSFAQLSSTPEWKDWEHKHPTEEQQRALWEAFRQKLVKRIADHEAHGEMERARDLRVLLASQDTAPGDPRSPVVFSSEPWESSLVRLSESVEDGDRLGALAAVESLVERTHDDPAVARAALLAFRDVLVGFRQRHKRCADIDLVQTHHRLTKNAGLRGSYDRTRDPGEWRGERPTYIQLLNDFGYLFDVCEPSRPEGRNLLTDVTRIAPKRAVAWLNLADLQHREGEFYHAEGSYSVYLTLRAEEGKPPVARALRRTSTLYRAQSRYDVADYQAAAGLFAEHAAELRAAGKPVPTSIVERTSAEHYVDLWQKAVERGARRHTARNALEAAREVDFEHFTPAATGAIDELLVSAEELWERHYRADAHAIYRELAALANVCMGESARDSLCRRRAAFTPECQPGERRTALP